MSGCLGRLFGCRTWCTRTPPAVRHQSHLAPRTPSTPGPTTSNTSRSQLRSKATRPSPSDNDGIATRRVVPSSIVQRPTEIARRPQTHGSVEVAIACQVERRKRELAVRLQLDVDPAEHSPRPGGLRIWGRRRRRRLFSQYNRGKEHTHVRGGAEPLSLFGGTHDDLPQR